MVPTLICVQSLSAAGQMFSLTQLETWLLACLTDSQCRQLISTETHKPVQSLNTGLAEHQLDSRLHTTFLHLPARLQLDGAYHNTMEAVLFKAIKFSWMMDKMVFLLL
jgi:hypothetical protein